MDNQPQSNGIVTWHLPDAPYPNVKVEPNRIGILNRNQDYHVALLGSLGFHYSVIGKHTSLSKGQVGARLKKAHVKTKDYRNGVGPIAQLVIERAALHAGRMLTKSLIERGTR
jgi:hypothetical protein